MEYRKLGNTDIDVSVICLGTMTWGEQNTEADAFTQMGYALDHQSSMRFRHVLKRMAKPRPLSVIGSNNPATGIKSFSHPRSAVPPAGARISAKENHGWTRKILLRPVRTHCAA